MSQKLLGIDIYRTDTTPVHELGMIVEEVRGGQGEISFKEFVDGPTQFRRFSPDALYKYVKASEALASGDGLSLIFTDTDEPAVVKRAAVATESIDGVAIVGIASASYGWIQTRGRIPPGIASATATDRLGVKVIDTNVAAGAFLRPTDTNNPGRLSAVAIDTAFVQATIQQVLAIAVGRGLVTLDAGADLDSSTNTDARAEVYIY